MRILKETEIDSIIRLNQKCDKKQVQAFLTNLHRFVTFNNAESNLLFLNEACKWSASTKKACEAGIHLGQFPFAGNLRRTIPLTFLDKFNAFTIRHPYFVLEIWIVLLIFFLVILTIRVF